MTYFARDIIVVGGGTAGWLAALFFRRVLEIESRVTLIESPQIQPVGVGESTMPTLGTFLEFLGVSEADWMLACSATYKAGIRFDNWCTGDDVYYHPFFSRRSSASGAYSEFHLWLRHHHNHPNHPVSIAETCWPSTEVMLQRKSPTSFGDNFLVEQTTLPHAWHIDAGLLVDYLKRLAIERGIRHVSDTVQGLRIGPTGIDSVVTAANGDFRGDLYLDCTGFRRLLIGAMDFTFVDFGPYLLNDRAIAARVAYPSVRTTGTIDPFTTATAADHGWMWKIPLFTRLGMGYAYSSKFVSDEHALRELLQRLPCEPDGIFSISCPPGHSKFFWKANCVAIGLAGGFLEPLEATAISLITFGLTRMLDFWSPTQPLVAAMADRYNIIMTQVYEYIRDFLVLHYCFNQRNDSEYWLLARQPEIIPDSLRYLIAYLSERFPLGAWNTQGHGFEFPDESYACVLCGFRRYPRTANPYLLHLTNSVIAERLQQHRQYIQHMVRTLPDHYEYLARQYDLNLSETRTQPANR